MGSKRKERDAEPSTEDTGAADFSGKARKKSRDATFKSKRHSEKHSKSPNAKHTAKASSAPALDTEELEKEVKPRAAEFTEAHVRLLVALPPCFMGDPLRGVYEHLNCFLMKNVPSVGGIILSYAHVKVLTKYGRVVGDNPFLQFWVSAKVMVWAPPIGAILLGQINIQSADHLGLLLYNTFNVSIPASQIPRDIYQWTPSGAASSGEGENSETESTEDGGQDTQPRNIMGQWLHKDTGEQIGDDGWIKFTATKVNLVNDMISIRGTLLHVD
ncbi:hypothetical protein H4R34_000563 [Dimargaris verticillata]|uniref:RPA43 OB domain-containing protein n=1 Tax=Dimargaris verticillata TaxID=2761393 RepID=A0A9W8B7V7_9FUNG|nr:hypothetical protein H4R34_000563 [Dimargaris verticillata]